MKNSVLFKVFVAMILAIIAGWITGPTAQILGVPYVKIYGLIGQLFLNALMLVVVPLVTASIITGTARMGSEQSFGVLGAKTFGFYLMISTLSIAVGVTVFMLIPQSSAAVELSTQVLANSNLDILNQTQKDAFDRISDIILKLVPSNIIAVAAQGQMLGLIFFSILFGFFLSKIETQASNVLLNFWKGIFQIMMRITHLIMKALPIGVFGLVAKVVATTGIESVSSVALFFATVVASLLIFALVIVPLILFAVAGVNPILHLKALAPALFTAFSTSSSAATLPVTLECLEKRAGVSNRVCSFTVPLGTSLCMSGSALFICFASLFIAQVYGYDLSATNVIIIALLSLLTSFGIAGIPSACLISVVVVLQTIAVPVEGVALIMAVERILDMCRTAINVYGNATCAVLVARSEGERNVLSLPIREKVNG